jgi:hypothetical protein
MATSSLAYTVRTATGVARFDTSAEAWSFMRECDANGIAAGFPSLGKEA